MLIDKIIRTDVGHIDSVVRIITQHLLRQFLESLEAMRSTDLEERVAIFLHHGREKIIASLDARVFPSGVAVAVVIDQCLQAGESHVWTVLLVVNQGRDLEQAQIQAIRIQLNSLLYSLGRLSEKLIIV